MNGLSNIKKQLTPLITGLPWILGCFLLFAFAGHKIIQYSPTMYSSMAKIKLEDQKQAFSNNSLYQVLDKFSAENRIETEAEMLRSHEVISKALDIVNMTISIERIGKIKRSELYQKSPFHVEYDFVDVDLFDREFHLTFSDSGYSCSYTNRLNEKNQFEGKLDSLVEFGGNTIRITRNLEIKQSLLPGNYSMRIYSRESLINKIAANLDVKAIDKEISVLRIVYKDKVPERSADVVQAVCNAYISDFIRSKSKSANKTVDFIDSKLTTVGKELVKSEAALEKYKLENKIVNTLQETETGLREISKIKLQLINLEISEKEVQELEAYVNGGEYFNETAITFGFGDLLLTELVKKLKVWTDEKQDLLIKYTPESEQIRAVDNKIEEVKNYIREGIKSSKRSLETKKTELEASYNIASRQLDMIPVRERQLKILERDFRLQESVYDFLAKKKLESTIAASSLISYHRIIQNAQMPKGPVSPNVTLIRFISGFLGLFFGIAFVYIRKMINPRIVDKEDVEKNSLIPLVGIIRRVKGNFLSEFRTLCSVLLLKKEIEPTDVVCISSTVNNEGKSTVTKHMGQALTAMGYTVCTISFNQNCFPTFRGISEKENESPFVYPKSGLKIKEDWDTFKNHLTDLKSRFDFVVLDTPAASNSVEAIRLMDLSDKIFHVFRSRYTLRKDAIYPDLLREEYGFQNIKLLLTDCCNSLNYNGHFLSNKKIWNRFKESTIYTRLTVLFHKNRLYADK